MVGPAKYQGNGLARLLAVRLCIALMGCSALGFELPQPARQSGSRRRQLKPGTVLVREYQGQRHTVMVGREGFDWEGTNYPSLSAIARAITGTAWSGPRFFALRSAADGVYPKRRSGADPKRRKRLGRDRTAGDRHIPGTGPAE